MRLTLRTLLAWFDSVLLPAEQQALGEKVAASSAAPQLIARLRDVMERSALAAPRPVGRGLAADANTVAEYLDNTLPADRLEPFERICIESDMHLAEVAACHGALAEIARNPSVAAPLDPVARRRLLEAIRHRTQDPRLDPEHEAAIANARSLRAALQAAGGPQDESFPWSVSPAAAGRPVAGRRRAPLAAWLSAVVAVLLLAALGGLLAWSVQRGSGGRLAVAPPSAPPAVADRERPPPAAPSAPLVAAAAPPAAPAVPSQPAAVSPVEPPAEGPPPPEDTPTGEPLPATLDSEPPVPAEPPISAVEPPLPAAAPAPRVPQGDALAIAAPAVPVPAVEPAGTSAAPPAAPAQGADIVSGAGLLLHKAPEPGAAGRSGWKPLAQNAPLAAREQLLAPPYCHPEVTVGGVTIRLEPNTLATLARDADGTPRLEIVFGRAVVRSNAARPRLGITAGDLVGVVTDGLREQLCVEVALERSAGTDPATEPSRVRATVATTKSGIAWRQSQADGSAATQPLAGMAAEGFLEAGSRLVWDSIDPGSVAVQAGRAQPTWLAAPPAAVRRVQQDAAAALAVKAAVEPLEKGLRELSRHPRAENRIAAVATLALLGDYDELVALLSADTADRQLQEGQWRQLFDMTVPLALARGVNAATEFGKACDARGPDGKGADLLALAGGFDDATLADGGDERLVAALDAPELVLRRLAIRELLAITDPAAADRTPHPYRADQSQDLRRDSVAWWRKQCAAGRIRRSAAGPTP